MTITVRVVHEDDREAWQRLFRGYRDFYEKPHDAQVIERVWSWVTDPNHEVRSLVAERDGAVIGLANYRSFARPIDGGEAIFLDDMFTDPDARGSGAATALLRQLARIAHHEGGLMVRWVTKHDNVTARKLYDRVAQEIPFATYDMSPSSE